MDIKNNIKKYLKKRTTIINYRCISILGYRLLGNIDKMGAAKILKPSYYDIDEMIMKCEGLRKNIFNISNELDYDNRELVKNEVKKAEILQVQNLTDCRSLAYIYSNMGNKLLSKRARGLWMPIGYDTFVITAGEFVIIWVAIGIPILLF